jgi:hypothetical protein
MGVRSRDNVLPGVDVKAGDADGQGRGFAFICPTQRISKTTGELKPYLWVCTPELDKLKTVANDRTGEQLAELVRQAHGGRNGHDDPGTFQPSPWDDLAATIAANTRHDAVHKLASALRGRGGWRAGDALAYMRTVVFPLLDQTAGKDPHPYALAELETDVRDAFTRYEDGHETTGPTVLDEPAPAITLDECHAVFRRWLGKEYDLDVLDAVLATAAVERLDGDPLWLLVISGAGNAKTETVQALAGGGAIVTSTISSDGALLSGTPKREKAKDATGGLLRRIGDRGLLVIKDVTSIISANRDVRATVLAAMREIYDGYWERNLGVDGGRSLRWSGRLVVVGAVTTAWDRAHDVVAAMGDRFVLLRADSHDGRLPAGRRAIGNKGSEPQMRAELAAAAGGVLATVDPGRAVIPTEEETERLLAAADVVTLARTGVDYDYQGNVIDAHAPEMPTRFAKQLAQVLCGAVAVGMNRRQAMRLAIRCARDSMPPLRLAILDDVAANPGSRTSEVRRRLAKPWSTVDRQLQSLHMLGVLDCDEHEESGKAVWRYTVTAGIDPETLRPSPDLSPPTGSGTDRESAAEQESGNTRAPTDKSGDASGQVSGLPFEWPEHGQCVACGDTTGRRHLGVWHCPRCANTPTEETA